MDRKTFRRGDVIFRQGDAADSMYELQWGEVGFYLNYGTAEEKLLSKQEGDGYFGELGMLEHEPRSATAVALEEGTQLAEIREQELYGIFKSNPGRIIDMMQQLSARLRRLTRDYQAACETAANLVRAEDKTEDGAGDAMTREEIAARVAHYASEIDKTRAGML